MYTQVMREPSERSWDWQLAILVFLLLQVSAARLVTTNWAPMLYFTETLAAYGAILGLALGASRFGNKACIALVVAYTIMVPPWLMTAAVSDKLLLERLGHVAGILGVSLGEFMRRQPVKDTLFFVAFASLAFWLLALAAGYWAARHRNVLVGIIPSGIIVLVIQVYANYQLHGSWWLATHLFISMLLIGRVYFMQSKRIWSKERVYVSEESWPNILGSLFTVAAAAIVLAWLMPATISSVQAASDAWTNMTHGIRDRLSNAVTALNGPYGRPGGNFFGTSLLLGLQAATGDAQVFSVEVLKPPDSYLRYYWRGRVYDTYQNGQWSSSQASALDFEPGSGDLKVSDVQGRTEAQLRFTLQFPTQSLIYAPAEAVWTSRASSVQVTPVEGGLDDVLFWQTKQSMSSGNQYEVRSQIGDPDVPELRTASTDYPAWISDRYLQVPQNIRPDIEALAQQVAAGRTTPYDKAVAITNYLRANLRYTTNVPMAPGGQDPVAWVLFDYKQGFCNYYASAEVLMLRAVGVPARMAVGFAQGEYVNGVYIVRRKDAHAWPEVYFPALGWVEFEPTVSQQALVRSDPSAAAGAGAEPGRLIRPLDQQELGGPRPSEATANRPSVPFERTLTGRLLLIALGFVVLALLVFLFRRYRVLNLVPDTLVRAFENSGTTTPTWIRDWWRWNQLEPVERAFASINWSLRWLGRPPSMDATPSERAATLKKLLPPAAAHIEAVASELETGLFTPQPADLRRARRSGLLVMAHALRARIARLLGM